MREIDAVCIALQNQLPRLHPVLFDDLRDVSYLNFSAYAATTARGEYIVKVRPQPSYEESPEEFFDWLSWCSANDKEIWIHSHVNQAVPVPERVEGGFGQLEVAGLDGDVERQQFGYQIQTRLPYLIADILHARTFRWNWDTGVMYVAPEFRAITAENGLLTKIGRMARLIHQTPTSGYGGGWFSRREDFNAATESFDFASWDALVDHLAGNCDVPLLVAHDIVTLRDWRPMQQRIARLKDLDFEPRLFHGDLVCNLQNILVDAQTGEISGVVDWESSGSGPATHFECALSLRTWYRDGWPEPQIMENFAAFLRGYGLNGDEYEQFYKYDVDTLLVLLTGDLFCLALQGKFTLRSGGYASLRTLIQHILAS